MRLLAGEREPITYYAFTPSIFTQLDFSSPKKTSAFNYMLPHAQWRGQTFTMGGAFVVVIRIFNHQIYSK